MTRTTAIEWLPLAAALVLAAVALAAAHGRRGWLAAVFLAGLAAIAAVGWQQQRQRQIEADAAGLQARLAEIAGKPAATLLDPTSAMRQSAERLTELSLQVKQLEEKNARLQKAAHDRTISDATAANLSQYLRGFGSQRVVLSCPPGDVEAFEYANRIVGILKDAGWAAHGPEPSKIFGTEPSMAIRFYVNGAQTPPAAKILSEAFHKFDIPYESKISPSEAIPDPETVELFVPAKPSG